MSHSPSHHPLWIMALITAAPLGGQALAAQVGGGANQPPVPIEAQGVPPAIPDQEQPEILSRGPVHEAFAEPVNLQLQAGLTVPDPPPPSIEEVPPAERPQGQPFVWIPGYWAWDGDRNGYIWVSVCWRAAPPGMSWVPGYWAQVPGGWEWVAGLWTPAGVRELQYLPAPPAVGDVEPVGPAPSADMLWVPPCMYWSQGQYVRRDGYWLAGQPNWMWVPSHYVATPRGYLFAEGHWDYSLERRGVLFAPVYFPASVQGRAAFTYSPSMIIDVGLLRGNLFAYPRYSHYYFGDYYDDTYLRIGIYPWFDSRRLHTWYDPIYEHDRLKHQRAEPRWEERQRDAYHHRRIDKDVRPARTFREQEARLSRLPVSQRQAFPVIQPTRVAVAGREATVEFDRVNTDARERISRQATAVRTFRDERTHWESAKAGPPAAEPPRERAVTAALREPALVPPRKAKGFPPERVRIPAPPVIGAPGVPGIFRRGPPGQPASEDKDKQGRDIRESR